MRGWGEMQFIGGLSGLLFRFIDRAIEIFAVIAGICLVAVMLLICWGVAQRYYFNAPVPWITEIIEYSLIYITFLSAPWILRDEGHVRIDLVLSLVGTRVREGMELIGEWVSIALCLALIVCGMESVMLHVQRNIIETNVLDIHKAWLLTPIPLSGFLMAMQLLKPFCLQDVEDNRRALQVS